MKNPISLRGAGRKVMRRGFTLIEIVLVLAVGLGLIVGGIVFYRQAATSSDINDRTRAVVSIAAELFAQYRVADLTSGSVVVSKTNVMNAATMDLSLFRDITSITKNSGNTGFRIVMETGDIRLCNRLALGDFGPGITGATCGGTPADDLTIELLQ